MLSDIENQVKRFEQMLTAFEQLHTDELRQFEEQLTAYRQMQNDELRMLREQLKQLREQLSTLKAAEPEPDAPTQPPAASPQPVILTVSRRELLTGILRPSIPGRD